MRWTNSGWSVPHGERGPPRTTRPTRTKEEALHVAAFVSSAITPATHASSFSKRAGVDVVEVGAARPSRRRRSAGRRGCRAAPARRCSRSLPGRRDTTMRSKRPFASRPRRAAAPRSRSSAADRRAPRAARASARYSRETSGCSSCSRNASDSGSSKTTAAIRVRSGTPSSSRIRRRSARRAPPRTSRSLRRR